MTRRIYSAKLKSRLEDALQGSLILKSALLPHIDGTERNDRRFGQRIGPVELFIERVQALAAPLGDDEFKSARDIIDGPPPSHRLSFSFNEASFAVTDPFALRRAFPAGAHANNLNFQASIANAVPAFAAAVVYAHPTLRPQIEHELTRLDRNVSSHCHDALKRAGRIEKWYIADEKRRGLNR